MQMKRSTLFRFSFIMMLLAISICFFSSAVFAGEGSKGDWGDTHPWDVDVIVIDTTEGTISALSVTNGSSNFADPFLWVTFTLSNRLSVWFNRSEFMLQDKKQIEVIKKSEIKTRGSYRIKN